MMIIKYLSVAILLSPTNVVVSLAEEEDNPIPRVLPYADKNPAPSPSISKTSNNMPHFPSVLPNNKISCMEEIVDKSTPPASPIPLFTKKDGDINDVPLNVLAIACGAILSSSKSKTSPISKPIIWEAEGDDFAVSNDGVKLPDKIIWELEGDDFRTQEGTGSIVINKEINGDSGGPFGIWQLVDDISVNMPDLVAKRIWAEESGDFIVKLIWEAEADDFIVQAGKVTYSVRNNIKQNKWIIANEGSDYRGYQKRNIRY